MPKRRMVAWGEGWVRLSELARAHHLHPATLASRLDRGTPVELALLAPVLTRSQAGRRGYAASHWRNE
jgi:hypothetical protein